MISHLQGRLLIKEPTRLVVQAGGIGFELKVPLSTSRRLPDPGSEVNLLVVMGLNPSGIELYGFLDSKEKEVFELLTSVKGVGPKAALNLLSRFEPQEIKEAIAERKESLLRSVPGIGPKKAGEILKRFHLLVGDRVQRRKEELPQIFADAVSALVSLGLSRREAERRVKSIQFRAGMSVQEVLKIALSRTR